MTWIASNVRVVFRCNASSHRCCIFLNVHVKGFSVDLIASDQTVSPANNVPSSMSGLQRSTGSAESWTEYLRSDRHRTRSHLPQCSSHRASRGHPLSKHPFRMTASSQKAELPALVAKTTHHRENITVTTNSPAFVIESHHNSCNFRCSVMVCRGQTQNRTRD